MHAGTRTPATASRRPGQRAQPAAGTRRTLTPAEAAATFTAMRDGTPAPALYTVQHPHDGRTITLRGDAMQATRLPAKTVAAMGHDPSANRTASWRHYVAALPTPTLGRGLKAGKPVTMTLGADDAATSDTDAAKVRGTACVVTGDVVC